MVDGESSAKGTSWMMKRGSSGGRSLSSLVKRQWQLGSSRHSPEDRENVQVREVCHQLHFSDGTEIVMGWLTDFTRSSHLVFQERASLHVNNAHAIASAYGGLHQSELCRQLCLCLERTLNV